MLPLAFPAPFLAISKTNTFPIQNKVISSCSTKLGCSQISLPKFRRVLTRASTNEKEEEEEEEEEVIDKPRLPGGLEADLMPKHVAIFMDGHRRWAKHRDLTLEQGYRAGKKPVMEIAHLCYAMGIKVLSVFALSTRNFMRPKEDVSIFADMFREAAMLDLELVNRLDIRLSVIGNISMLPEPVQQLIAKVEEVTKTNSRLHLIGAIGYNGQSDITQACTSVASKVKDGLIQLEDINESLFDKELETKCTEFPSPDLLIRTGGDVRLSNFMLWQLAYTELYFVDKLAPDFDGADFIEALSSFQKRRRCYGGHKY